ncbi:unnamed protein product [Sympodiomycopsis kandeliae]
MDLFSDDEEDHKAGTSNIITNTHEPEFAINTSYANRFQHNKERAELHRLEEKYGQAAADVLSGKRSIEEFEDSDDSDSSEDESEDEQGEQVTAEIDAAILRTLAKIKSGDADIYDSSKRVFDEEKALAAASELLPSRTRSKVDKKVTLADYQRNRLKDLIKTEKDPALALANATTSTTREDERRQAYRYGYEDRQPLSHVQEQEQLRRQVTQAFHTMDGDEQPDANDDEEEEGFFEKRAVTSEGDDDPDAYRKYLLANLGDGKSEAAVRDALSSSSNGVQEEQPAKKKTKKSSSQKKSSSGAAAENEEFLMNYILNRGWMENPQNAPRGSKRAHQDSDDEDESDDDQRGQNGGGRDWGAEAADLDAASDASFDSRAEAFEQAFNFRYEALEAGKISDQVQSYSRAHQNANSVRRVEDKRKQERAERKKRKDEEKQSKMDAIHRMRELQRNSLRDKLKQLKSIAGSKNLNINLDDLEGDFDPDKHDKLMGMFGEEYYGEEDDDDDQKPVWSDDDEEMKEIMGEDYREPQEAEEEEKVKKKEKKSKNQKKKEARRAAQDQTEGQDADEDQEMADGDGDGDEGASDVKLSKKERKKLKKQAKKAASAETPVDTDQPASSSSSAPAPMSGSERLAAERKLKDEYHALDYEDMIGDLPTRFHYTPVTKTSYGLTPVEILMGNDKDLNDVIGLKYFQPYRKSALQNRKPRDLNRKLKEFRRRLDEKQDKSGDGKKRVREDGEAGGEGKKRKGKKERQKEKMAAQADEGGKEGEDQGETSKSAAREGDIAKSTDMADADDIKAQKRKEKKERKRALKAAASATEGQTEES